MISNPDYFDAFTTFGKFLKDFSSTKNLDRNGCWIWSQIHWLKRYTKWYEEWDDTGSAVVAKSEDPLKMQPVIIIKRGSTSVVILLPYFLQFWKEYIP